MEQGKKAKRTFTPEQKMHIVQMIETDIKAGLKTAEAVEKQGIPYSSYAKWRKQLAVGVKASLRNGKPPVDKEKRRLERENERLKAIVVSQAQAIADLKKETNWD
jgi:transposase-like protein